MRSTVQMGNSNLTAVQREYVECRLAYMLSPFPEHIRSVVIVLSDISGPRGGINKRRDLRVRLKGLADILVEETEADFHVAVNRAADRAKRTLVRRLLRVRDTLIERAS